jgi:hypothetical protein
VSPNSHGSIWSIWNLHKCCPFWRSWRSIWAIQYTCSTLAPKVGPAASINNHLATANACAPPPYLQVLATVDIGLVTQVVHTMGVVDRDPQVPPLQGLGTVIFVGRLHLKQWLKICDATSTNSGGFHEMFMSWRWDIIALENNFQVTNLHGDDI